MNSFFYHTKRFHFFSMLSCFLLFPGILSAAKPYKFLVISSKFYQGKAGKKYLTAGKKILKEEFSRRSNREGIENLRILIDDALNPTLPKPVAKAFIDCKAKCLKAIRKLMKEDDSETIMLLTIAQKERKIRLQLLVSDEKKKRVESSFCENCNISKFKTVLLQLVQKTFDYNQTSIKKNKKHDQPFVKQTQQQPETTSVGKKKKNISAEAFYGWGSFTGISSSVLGLQSYWNNLGLCLTYWDFKFKTSVSDLKMNTLTMSFGYQFDMRGNVLPFGDRSREEVSVALGWIASGSAKFQYTGDTYQSSSPSGYDFMTTYGKKFHDWKGFLGFLYHNRSLKNLVSSNNSKIKDQNFSWINLSFGAGWTF